MFSALLTIREVTEDPLVPDNVIVALLWGEILQSNWVVVSYTAASLTLEEIETLNWLLEVNDIIDTLVSTLFALY